MSELNRTPAAERAHLTFLGRRNVGKSSLINAFTGQEVSVVSPVKGTTTDPVSKAMELLPLGPVMILDTPGLDDEGELGQLRVRRTRQSLNRTDLALVVLDAVSGLQEEDRELLDTLQKKNIPYLLIYNKADLLDTVPPEEENSIYVSAKTGLNLHALREKAARALVREVPKQPLIADLVQPGDTVVLVIPLDASAPKGRLILPQQMVIRDLLEAGASALCCRDTELETTLSALSAPPRLVVTDSQMFGKVAKTVPSDVPMTSFSILMARYKGSLPAAVAGAAVLDSLRDGDRVLIAEGCTHHRQCEDIGTVKIPRWIREKTGTEPEFVFSSGNSFPEDLTGIRLVIHCGACTLPEKEVRFRMACCRDQGVPVTNYGIAIAHLHGILRRSVAPFPQIAKLLDK